MDELADVKQKEIDAVVSVELDPPEMLGTKIDRLNGCEPTEQVKHIGTSVFVEFDRVAEALERGLEDAIGQGVIFEFVPRQGLRIDFGGGKHLEEVVGIEGTDQSFGFGAAL